MYMGSYYPSSAQNALIFVFVSIVSVQFDFANKTDNSKGHLDSIVTIMRITD